MENLKEYIKDLKEQTNEEVKTSVANNNVYTIKLENNTDFIINKKNTRVDKDFVILISQDLFVVKDNKTNNVTKLKRHIFIKQFNSFFNKLEEASIILTKVEWINSINRGAEAKNIVEFFIFNDTRKFILKNGLYKEYKQSSCQDLIFEFGMKNIKLFKYALQQLKPLNSSNRELIELVMKLDDSGINYNNIKYFIDLAKESGIKCKNYYDLPSNLIDIIKDRDYNLDINSLFEYLTFCLSAQGLELDSCIFMQNYKDYLRMEFEMAGKIKDKYPKYLKTQHDITVKKYNTWKQHKNDLQIFNNSELHKDLEYKDKNYSIIIPESSEEVLDEALQQHNCLASYIGRIVEDKSVVLFMRSNNDLDKSLVTIEVVDNEIRQALQKRNTKVTKEQKDFLVKWAKEKELNYNYLNRD